MSPFSQWCVAVTALVFLAIGFRRVFPTWQHWGRVLVSLSFVLTVNILISTLVLIDDLLY